MLQLYSKGPAFSKAGPLFFWGELIETTPSVYENGEYMALI